MRYETRIEVIAVIAGTMGLAGWFGMKALNARQHGEKAAQPPTAIVVPAQKQTKQPIDAPQVKSGGAINAKAETVQVAKGTLVAPEQPKALEARKRKAAEPVLVRAGMGGSPAAAESLARPAEGIIDQKMLDEAKQLIAQEKRYEARLILTRLLLAAPEGAQRQQIKQMLDDLNAVIFFSKAPSPDAEFHVVQRGDTLSKLALNAGKDVYFSQCIMKINGIANEKNLRLDQKVKIPKNRFSALVQRGNHRLLILVDGQYLKEYTVATGAPVSPTPLGRFVIGNNKMINPDWFAPDGKVYKFGEPENILGTRWLGLKETEEHKGYGIHGTSKPETVGQSVSNGCVRMLNSDVEEVFTMLSPGDEVVIVQ